MQHLYLASEIKENRFAIEIHSTESLFMMKTMFVSYQDVLITFIGGIVTFGGLGGVSNERRKLTCFFCSVNWQ